jgi:hypothetical protein
LFTPEGVPLNVEITGAATTVMGKVLFDPFTAVAVMM